MSKQYFTRFVCNHCGGIHKVSFRGTSEDYICKKCEYYKEQEHKTDQLKSIWGV